MILFVMGLCVGSFLNVLIDRLPRGESPWRGRSHCDHCKRTLTSWELIPLLSFVILKGKSHCCHKSLSSRMPLVELVTGILFVLTWWHTFAVVGCPLPTANCQLSTISLLIIFSSFLVILFVDIKHHIIPDEMVITSIVGGLMLHFFSSSNISIYQYIATGIGASLFLFVIFLATKGRGMGFGDVKLALALGLFLGPAKTVVGMYLAFLTGAVVSLILIFSKQKQLKSKIAFGPFLIIGSVASFYWGDLLLKWYLNFF